VSLARLSPALVMLIVGAALLVEASTAGISTAEARKGGTLRMASFEDVGQLDTALGYAPIPFAISFATCAKLFNHPDEAGAAGTRVIPEVVQSHTVSLDGRTYDFELRRTYRFHTGAQVTAQSFADAFNRDADPRMRSPATTFIREIEGARAVIDGTAQSISGIRVLGRFRLQVRLTKALGDFPARLTLPFFCPILPNTPVDPRGIGLPGSGPFYVAEHVVTQRVVLERNPFYRGGRPANVDEVVWTSASRGRPAWSPSRRTASTTASRSASPSRRTDLLPRGTGSTAPGGQLFVSPALNTWYLAFNHDRPAFKGPGQIPLKKAINLAIDDPSWHAPSATSSAGVPTHVDLMRNTHPWRHRAHTIPRVRLAESRLLPRPPRLRLRHRSRVQEVAAPGHGRVSRSAPSLRERSRSSAARESAPSSSARAAARSRYAAPCATFPLCAW
jgi:ABC-type oligopeptide transport system substrate-binding subunit